MSYLIQLSAGRRLKIRTGRALFTLLDRDFDNDNEKPITAPTIDPLILNRR